MASNTPSAAACTPPEVWRVIMSFATLSATSFVVDYEPFQRGREFEGSALYFQDESFRLKTCLALVRVCQLWRTIGEEFLYRDVRLGNSARALRSLIDGLQRSAREERSGGVGRFVRRLELPTAYLPSGSSQARALPIKYLSDERTASLSQLLRLCCRLEILVRPPLRLDSEDIQLWGELISEPVCERQPTCAHLRRLEWSENDLDVRFHGSTSSKRLSEIMSRAPNLQYLFLSSDRADLTKLTLGPSLRTLRLHRSHYTSRRIKELQDKSTISVPNLTNLVLDTTLPSTTMSFLSTVGQQIRVLEFTFAPQVTYSSNQLYRILSRCPNLEELVYHLGAPEISPLPHNFQHKSLRRVRLKISAEQWPVLPFSRAHLPT
ncbi:hypothetical protein C8F01DRAFT_587594 [Mycena amicta]|nr:hypothetical protein C8F01DRAFT_587594 [Mycena amicta]